VDIAYTAEGSPLGDSDLQIRFAAGLAQEGIVIVPQMTSFHRLDAPLQTLAGKRVTLKKEIL
jgi:hypothetical protein